MGSSAKKRQTFSKMTRERALQEKREAKRQKKADRKAAAAGEEGTAVDEAADGPTPESQSEATL
jgi:hypothetical protein